MHRISELLRRFRRDENGAFMVLFAVLAIVLIATSGAVVDFTYTQTARSRAQDALDAATLAMQAKIQDINNGSLSEADAKAEIKTQATEIMQERLADGAITAEVNNVDIDTSAGKLNLQAQITVPTAFVQLVGVRNITATLTSEAVRGSTDLEVSVALDVTASMNMPSTKIQALREATQNLIKDIVQDTQPPTAPTYTKMALVPYSYGVNVGAGNSYANQIRGTPQTVSKTFNGGAWASGSAKTISTATRGSPVTITTSSNHGFSTGDTVYISGVGTLTSLNKQAYKITVTASNKFTLNGTNVGGFQNGSGGSVTKCLYANCDVKLTGTGIGNTFASNDGVYLTSVSGYTSLRNTGFFITKIDSNTILLKNSLAAGGSTSTSVSGTITRANYGDVYYHFVAATGDEQTFSASNCVTERPGANAFTDAPPSTTLLNFMYPSSAGNCVSQMIVPLSSDKTALTNVAKNLSPAGSTAGHIGLAWAWYMLSPNFAYLWPTDSKPAAYKKNNLIKALILMTDGMFNTAYCNGVISQDSDAISGTSNMIACNAPDGVSTSQAASLCDAIKNPNNGIELYTVGFDIGGNSQDEKDARKLLSDCATDTNHFFQADTADDLKDAFKKIAQNLNKLRLSK